MKKSKVKLLLSLAIVILPVILQVKKISEDYRKEA